MAKIKEFLSEELKLELSEEKTKITNIQNDAASFLSVNIRRFNHTKFRRVKGRLTRVTDSLRLTAPIDKIVKKLKTNGFIKEGLSAPRYL